MVVADHLATRTMMLPSLRLPRDQMITFVTRGFTGLSHGSRLRGPLDFKAMICYSQLTLQSRILPILSLSCIAKFWML